MVAQAWREICGSSWPSRWNSRAEWLQDYQWSRALSDTWLLLPSGLPWRSSWGIFPGVLSFKRITSVCWTSEPVLTADRLNDCRSMERAERLKPLGVFHGSTGFYEASA